MVQLIRQKKVQFNMGKFGNKGLLTLAVGLLDLASLLWNGYKIYKETKKSQTIYDALHAKFINIIALFLNLFIIILVFVAYCCFSNSKENVASWKRANAFISAFSIMIFICKMSEFVIDVMKEEYYIVSM